MSLNTALYILGGLAFAFGVAIVLGALLSNATIPPARRKHDVDEWEPYEDRD